MHTSHQQASKFYLISKTLSSIAWIAKGSSRIVCSATSCVTEMMSAHIKTCFRFCSAYTKYPQYGEGWTRKTERDLEALVRAGTRMGVHPSVAPSKLHSSETLVRSESW